MRNGVKDLIIVSIWGWKFRAIYAPPSRFEELGPIGPSLGTLVPMIFNSPIIKKIIPTVKLLLPKLLTLLLHLLYCLKVVNIKFGMFTFLFSSVFGHQGAIFPISQSVKA